MNIDEYRALGQALEALGMKMPTDQEAFEEASESLDKLVNRWRTGIVEDPSYDPEDVPHMVRVAGSMFFDAMLGKDEKGDVHEQAFYSYLLAVAVWRLVEQSVQADDKVVAEAEAQHD
jgi:hypothetical protein